LFWGLLMGLLAPTIFDSRADFREEIPFAPTPIGVVDQMLELAEVVFSLCGCASFEPAMRYQDLMRPRLPTVKETQDGLEISVEEFASKNKSLQAFDADLAPHGILALLLKVENNGTQTYSIDEQGISAYLGIETLPLISREKAASQAANSEYVGKPYFGL